MTVGCFEFIDSVLCYFFFAARLLELSWRIYPFVILCTFVCCCWLENNVYTTGGLFILCTCAPRQVQQEQAGLYGMEMY